MRGAKSAKWVAIAAVVALGATACGGGGGDKGSDSKAAVNPAGKFSVEVGEPQNPLQLLPTPWSPTAALSSSRSSRSS